MGGGITGGLSSLVAVDVAVTVGGERVVVELVPAESVCVLFACCSGFASLIDDLASRGVDLRTVAGTVVDVAVLAALSVAFWTCVVDGSTETACVIAVALTVPLTTGV